MTSKLAKSQIELWWKEGLNPTFDDIVKLNDLGLAVERGTDMFSFSLCPRLAFLGDRILKEPTVAKRIWIDEAQGMFSSKMETKVQLLAYALGTDSSELPNLHDAKKIQEEVEKFRDTVLMNCTETQILAAVDYVMNGDKIDTSEFDEDEKKQIDEVYNVPCRDESLAKQLLMSAMLYGIPAEVKDYALLEELRNMTLAAAIQNGSSNTVKNEHAQIAGRFYVAAGKIHERLMNEKNAKNEDVKK